MRARRDANRCGSTFLHLGAPAQTTIPLNPGFIDSRFEYAAETVIQTVTLTATVPLGASVRWLYEHVITIGQAVTIDLHLGGNLVNITVTQSGHRSSNYAIVITTALDDHAAAGPHRHDSAAHRDARQLRRRSRDVGRPCDGLGKGDAPVG